MSLNTPENTEGFYKLEVGSKRSVLFRSTHLLNKDWELTLANKDSFTFPHDGWQYYDSIASACTALNLNLDDEIMRFYPDYNPEEFEKRNGISFGE